MKMVRFLLISTLLLIGIPHDKLPPHEEQKFEATSIMEYAKAFYSWFRLRFPKEFYAYVQPQGQLDIRVIRPNGSNE